MLVFVWINGTDKAKASASTQRPYKALKIVASQEIRLNNCLNHTLTGLNVKNYYLSD